MRKASAFASLLVLTAVVAACSSSASSPGASGPPAHPYRTAPPNPTSAPVYPPTNRHGATPYPVSTPFAASTPYLPPTLIPGQTPYGDVTFANPGVNPYVDPRTDRDSTFGLDVDTASYAIARRFVDDGNLPDPNGIRVEEFVNSFDQGYASPDDGCFRISLDAAPVPFLPGDQVLLRVGIRARDVDDETRPDAALTFVIDTSGSMADGNRLELVKQSLRLLVRSLSPQDSVAVVAFSTDARVVLPPTRARDDERILASIDELQPDNTTNVEAGLRLGYGLARESLVEGGINRVVLASDGVANVGLTDSASILGEIRHDSEAGIQLVSVGVGMGNYNDALLEQLADQGDGFYAYVNTLDEARTLFVEDLTGTLPTVALDARVQVEFDPSTVTAYRLIGFENRAIPDQDFRSDDVEAGAIEAGHEVTALYAVRPNDELRRGGRLATVLLRWKDPASGRALEIARDVRTDAIATSFHLADPHLKLDAIVATTAEILRGSPWLEEESLSRVRHVADEQAETLPATDEVREFRAFLDAVSELRH